MSNGLTKSDKVLLAVYELSKEDREKENITVEDVAVKLWKTYPSEFCMKGYPEYPNVDIQKYFTKLFDNDLLRGGVTHYEITKKGEQMARSFKDRSSSDGPAIDESALPKRYVKTELNRILNSKVYEYYTKSSSHNFVLSDLFDFMGTSTRSLKRKDKNMFLARYNKITKDVIPFCEEHKNEEKARNIISLWQILSDEFSEVIEERLQ